MQLERTPSATGYDAIIELPFGPFGIRMAGAEVRELVFLPPGTPLLEPTSAAARAAADALRAWVAKPDAAPALRLAPCGTDFQRRVWAQIRSIPPGSTRTYGELAAHLGSAARAVGQACANNPFPLIVPCHRVTSASGLGGFAHAREGWLLAVKRWLLAHEAAL